MGGGGWGWGGGGGWGRGGGGGGEGGGRLLQAGGTHAPGRMGETKSLANKVFDQLFEHAAFSQWLGIERILIETGRCVLRMKVRTEMLNGFGIAHGGITYSLADSALAFASNSHGRKSVSVETSISHTVAMREGDEITATAEEV